MNLPFHNVGKSPDGGGVAGTAILDDKVAIFAVLGGGLRPHCAYEEFEVWEKEKLVIQCKLPGKSFQSIRMISEAPAALPDAVVKVKYLVAAAYDLVCLYEDPLIDPSGRPVLAQPEKFNTVLDNLYGLCCLSRHLLVIPSRTKGQVQLIKLKGRKEGRTISIVRAHDGPLRALELSRDGTLLATASTKGTLIRVWSTINNTLLAELRRGVDPADIFSLAISPSNRYLACTSDKGTLHIFDLRRSSSTSDQKERRTSVTRPNLPDRSRTTSNASSDFESVSHFDAPVGDDNATNSTAPSPRLSTFGALQSRFVSGTTSSASRTFSVGDEPEKWQSLHPRIPNRPLPSSPEGKPPKGLIAWANDEMLHVVGGGRDPRWEQFRIVWNAEGKMVLVLDGMKRYLTDVFTDE
ncbi:hypothetical protein LTR04_006030 [Oleoguttula sp. CCFEE 6159]|nr:hypothetical protein LTR04_006030 [Oleoguttula sp. CCFEE 6159]